MIAINWVNKNQVEKLDKHLTGRKRNMIRFLIDNPTLTACGLLCIWPTLLSAATFYIGRKIGRRGMPRLVWPGMKEEEDI